MWKFLQIAVFIVLLHAETVLSQNVFKCGVPQITVGSRILRGYDTAPGEWPWHVAIHRRDGETENFACGGTLVTKRHVITVAHCFDVTKNEEPKLFTVRLGVYQLNSSEDGIQHRIARKIHWVENTKKFKHFNKDIAILELATEVEFGKYVQPACMDSTMDIVGQLGTVIGWGIDENDRPSNVLKSATAPVVDFFTCLRSNRAVFGEVLEEDTFCAGYTNGTTVCNGDSGGGVFFQQHDIWYLGGIVSLSQIRGDGSNRCMRNSYRLFTKIQPYLEWIDSVVRLSSDEGRSESININANTNRKDRLQPTYASSGISVIGPKLIRPGSMYKVALSNTLPFDVQLQIQLDNGVEVMHRKETRLSRISAKTVSFNVSDISHGDYFLTVDGLDYDFSKRVELSVLIQTDKPVYKPGDRIRFRVVVIDVDTRPVKNIQTISVGLTDEGGHSISQWPHARLHNGVFESAVQLASAPHLGRWTLMVTTEEGSTEKHVDVFEYVLPKFSVEAAPSKVLLENDTVISITVKAQYTFGEPVDGTATVNLYLRENSYGPDFYQTKSITGATTFGFKLYDAVKFMKDMDLDYVSAVVTVMETFSNRTKTVTQRIPVHRNPFQMSLLPLRPVFYPGEAFPIDLSVKDHLNQPPKAPGIVELTVHIKETGEELDSIEEWLDEDGMASFTLNPPLEAELLLFSVKYGSVEYEPKPKEIKAYQSKSNQYIKIKLNSKSRVQANEEIILDVTCSEPMTHFSYVVAVRGSIIASSLITLPNKKQKYSFKYKLSPEMSPDARIIVFYTTGEYLVYDDLELHFEDLKNDFTLQLNKQKFHPGQEVYVKVQAAKDSYIAFQAVDQSVLLVGEDSQSFTRDDVLKELSLSRTTSSNDADFFAKIGLFLESNAKIDTAIVADHTNGDRYRRSMQPYVRTAFPESCLWVSHTMNGRSTHFEFSYIVPDTITSWYVSGFALSPTLGLGLIRQPVKFEVRQPFFLVANLPYSIKRDEVALIQVTVFNFLGYTINSTVTLFNMNDEIEFVEKFSSDNTRRSKMTAVPTNNGKAIYFLIKAKKLGEIDIKVQANNVLATDAINFVLRVTPESHRFLRNAAFFIDLNENAVRTVETYLDIPQEIEEGSVKIKLTLDPDLLGNTIQNLENLIRLPIGCGEQSMMNFVPNVVILDYLTETENAPEHFKAKAIDFLKSGYQNQLRYKFSDGSFGVFRSDSYGSTFLTAFVAKSFKLASKYIDVDNQVVHDAFEWLADSQLSDGRFFESRKSALSYMQGGYSTQNFALTSYVLIAFTEDEEIARQYSSVVIKTMNYLASNFEYINDPYDLALSSYGLALEKHPDRTKFFNKLLETSIYNRHASIRYWHRPPVTVEIAGYALLTYIENGQYGAATPVMRWLNQQRYDRGGYEGTQDTFVGLKALAKYAVRQSQHRNDYQVNIKYNSRTARSINVDQQNSMVVLEQDIPDDVRRVEVEFNGIGHSYFQIAYQYYQKIEEGKQSFDMQVELLPTTSYYVQHLNVCVSYRPTLSHPRTGMVLVEVFFPSGMIADTNAVKSTTEWPKIKKTELRLSATSVVVYYEKLLKNPGCFEVTAYRKHKVALQLPAYVVAYDYYDRERIGIKEYQGRVLSLCDICEDEDCESLQC